jgi:hypothetical protein
MCHPDRSQQRTTDRTASETEDIEDTPERRESPSREIVDAPVRALKRAHALIT